MNTEISGMPQARYAARTLNPNISYHGLKYPVCRAKINLVHYAVRAAYPTFFVTFWCSAYVPLSARLCYRRFFLLHWGNGTTSPNSLYRYLSRFLTHCHSRMPPALAVSDRCNGFGNILCGTRKIMPGISIISTLLIESVR